MGDASRRSIASRHLWARTSGDQLNFLESAPSQDCFRRAVRDLKGDSAGQIKRQGRCAALVRSQYRCRKQKTLDVGIDEPKSRFKRSAASIHALRPHGKGWALSDNVKALLRCRLLAVE